MNSMNSMIQDHKLHILYYIIKHFQNNILGTYILYLCNLIRKSEAETSVFIKLM